jgi:hypothetical protein
MKPPHAKIAFKMPMPAAGRALVAGRTVLEQFAHHAPAVVEPKKRMERPKGGKGAKN